MSDTYSAVDRSANVAEAVDWQDRIDAWPAIDAYKRRTYDLLGDAWPVLDVGCGTGHDLVRLGAGSMGADASLAMCQRARSRGSNVFRGDILCLPIASGSFAGVRADRVLQHLVDPAAASASLLGRITALRRDVGYRNGLNARRLPRMFAELGLVDVTVDAFPLVLTDPDDAFGLPGWVEYWRTEGPFDDAAVTEWNAAMHDARETPGFVLALLYLVVSGRTAG